MSTKTLEMLMQLADSFATLAILVEQMRKQISDMQEHIEALEARLRPEEPCALA